MKMKSTIQRSVVGGSFTYGIVEAYNLGQATIRLAEGGARLTSLPVMSYVCAGLRVIVDYTNDVPSVRRAGTEAIARGSRPLPIAYVIPRSENIANTWVPEP